MGKEDYKIIVDYVNSAADLAESVAYDLANFDGQISEDTQDKLTEFIKHMRIMSTIVDKDETDRNKLN